MHYVPVYLPNALKIQPITIHMEISNGSVLEVCSHFSHYISGAIYSLKIQGMITDNLDQFFWLVMLREIYLKIYQGTVCSCLVIGGC